MGMETVLLVFLGVLSLAIIGQKARRTVKAITDGDEPHNCASCGSCRSSGCSQNDERKCKI